MSETKHLVWMYLRAILTLFCGTVSCHVITGANITSLYACTDIKYRFATTQITSHVVNPSNQSRQAVFDIILPNDAFISNFSLTVDGQIYPGRVVQRGEAVRKFGANSTRAGASTGRVSQRPRETNQFRVTLKVAPQQGVTFNLTYQEILERRLGFYDHVLYIDPGQPVDDMRVDVAIEENREISYLHVPPIRSGLLTDFGVTESNSLVRVERPSGREAHISYHPSAKHQQLHGMSSHGLSGLFTVRYDVNRTMDAGELLSVNGYFVHFIAPPVTRPIPKNVLFILDTSTSMMWEKLSQLQDALRVILTDLSPADRFALMQFNSRATFWKRELLPVTPTTIQWAMEYVDTLKARGYTNIDSALAQGLDFFNQDNTVKGNNSLIIFLTDGRPTRGETDRDAVLKNVRVQNRKHVAVYGLAFGKDADWPLVKRLASQNQGVGRRIYQDADAALQIQGFYSEVSTLLLTGVHALYLDSEVDKDTLTRTFFSNFFNGSEMVVAGRLIRLNQTALRVVVQATGQEGNVNLTLTRYPDPLVPGKMKSCGLLQVKDLTKMAEKMWAYLTIRQLLQQRVGEDDELKKRQLKEKATQLALRFNFVTPLTSLLVNNKGMEELAYLHEDASELFDERDEVTPENGGPSNTAAPSTAAHTTTETTVTSQFTTNAVTPTSAFDGSSSASDASANNSDNLESSSSTRKVSPTTQINPSSPDSVHSDTEKKTPYVGDDDKTSTETVRGDQFVGDKDSGPRVDTAHTTQEGLASSSPVAISSTLQTVDRPTSGPVTGGGSVRGGGGGDPHFMVEMKSLPYPLCFDVKGATQDAFRLLKDPRSGLTVNAEMTEGRRKLNASSTSTVPLYITRVAILLEDVMAEVTTAHVTMNGEGLHWGKDQAVYVPGVWVIMKNSSLRFALDWSVEIDVTRHVRKRGEHYLNVEIQNEAHLSPDSTGLLGQFLHKEVAVHRIKRRHGKLVAELDIRNTVNGYDVVTHGRALVKTRRDPFFGRVASCLAVDQTWSHVMDMPARLYVVNSIFTV